MAYTHTNTGHSNIRVIWILDFSFFGIQMAKSQEIGLTIWMLFWFSNCIRIPDKKSDLQVPIARYSNANWNLDYSTNRLVSTILVTDSSGIWILTVKFDFNLKSLSHDMNSKHRNSTRKNFNSHFLVSRPQMAFL